MIRSGCSSSAQSLYIIYWEMNLKISAFDYYIYSMNSALWHIYSEGKVSLFWEGPEAQWSTATSCA